MLWNVQLRETFLLLSWKPTPKRPWDEVNFPEFHSLTSCHEILSWKGAFAPSFKYLGHQWLRVWKQQLEHQLRIDFSVNLLCVNLGFLEEQGQLYNYFSLHKNSRSWYLTVNGVSELRLQKAKKIQIRSLFCCIFLAAARMIVCRETKDCTPGLYWLGQ